MDKFRRIERTKNVLSAAERLSIGALTLQVGSLNEVVTVEAAGTYVNTAETQHSGLITSKQIEQIQVRSRDVTSLMRLVPGVRFEDNVEAMGESFGTLIPHVGGQRRDWNTVMIDGVLGNEIGQANRLAQTINLDSIAEVKVLLNNYRAEYGRTGGGQVQIITKSGGASYAGSVYYYGRHEKLNANNFFNNRQDRPKPRIPIQHLRRKSRRPGARREERICSSSTQSRLRSASGRQTCCRGRCRQTGNGGGTSRRRSTPPER